jgi:predicted nucleotidyltransferase
MILSPDFRDFIGSLEDNGVRYLVVGGYAVAFHGHPRYTKDIDIWIEREEVNAQRIVLALEAFGFGGLGISTDDFLVDDQIVQLGQPPHRIDLLTSVPGVDFEICYTGRIEVIVEGLVVRFISLEDLRQAKRASGRYQDLADLENLQ